MSNAVNKLMISDVPIETFLSGGIDSSLIVALYLNQIITSRPLISVLNLIVLMNLFMQIA